MCFGLIVVGVVVGCLFCVGLGSGLCGLVLGVVFCFVDLF